MLLLLLSLLLPPTLSLTCIPLNTTTTPLSLHLLTQFCVGHLNSLTPNSFYTLGSNGVQFPTSETNDQFWLDVLHPEYPVTLKSPVDFIINDCFPSINNFIEYDFDTQREFEPILVTLCVSLNALPVSVNSDVKIMEALEGMRMVKNVTYEWENKSNLEIVEEVFEEYKEGFVKGEVVKIDPGYRWDGGKTPLIYHLTKDMDYSIVDFAVQNRLFTFFLANGCVPLTADHRVEEKIFRHFKKGSSTTAVYGYDDSVPLFGGDTYEAETNCVREHDIGQVASTAVNNVNFYNTSGQIENLEPNPIPVVEYDPEKTYVAFIVGDGDNFWHLKNNHMKLFNERQTLCLDDPESCFPMSWSIAPAAAKYMSDIIRYYDGIAKNTTKDYFVLPPSGSLYSYPGLFPSDVQDDYINTMDKDMKVYNTRVSVHWEWFYNWRHAISTYFTKWSEFATSPRGFVLANVPYLLPVWIFRGKEYRMVGDNVVLFKPNEWRYSSQKQSHTTEEMADILNGFEKGYITPVYMTIDGSLEPIQATHDLVTKYLDDHVEIVTAESLVDLVIEKEATAQAVKK
ncbi:hypothetical protein TrVE_jg339 [Triparma verrucosa]|uniref:GxGYxYP putative glycoside hydrolase C-terminal domain-containing protein n=1 Tax=Triparma verrucosa TaxID=1606542 RepID=A0A9W7F317_9STRA|nr:hypothetical protein TrVE_jg339 [Triparma verrucosa]